MKTLNSSLLEGLKPHIFAASIVMVLIVCHVAEAAMVMRNVSHLVFTGLPRHSHTVWVITFTILPPCVALFFWRVYFRKRVVEAQNRKKWLLIFLAAILINSIVVVRTAPFALGVILHQRELIKAERGERNSQQWVGQQFLQNKNYEEAYYWLSRSGGNWSANSPVDLQAEAARHLNSVQIKQIDARVMEIKRQEGSGK